MKEIFPLLILVALIVSYFFQDWRAYECDEYLSEGAYRSGDTLSIHEKGGIISSVQDISFAFVANIIERRRLSRKKSRYGPYLDSWPTTFSRNPVFFKDEEL